MYWIVHTIEAIFLLANTSTTISRWQAERSGSSYWKENHTSLYFFSPYYWFIFSKINKLNVFKEYLVRVSKYGFTNYWQDIFLRLYVWTFLSQKQNNPKSIGCFTLIITLLYPSFLRFLYPWSEWVFFARSHILIYRLML